MSSINRLFPPSSPEPASEGRLYVSSAFSLNMLETPASIDVSELTLEEVIDMLHSYSWESCVGHESTARVMSQLTGVEIPVNRKTVKLARGDMMIVFQIMTRLPEGKVLSEEELKSIPTQWFLVEVFE